MNAKRKRSRKRSAASSKRPRKNKEHIFYIDEGIGAHVVSGALRDAGAKVETANNALYSGVPDEEWIKYVGKNKRLAITKDKRLRHREIEIRAIKKYKAKIFRFTSGNMSGKEMAEIAVKAIGKMEKYADKYSGPFVVSLTKGGKLSPLSKIMD